MSTEPLDLPRLRVLIAAGHLETLDAAQRRELVLAIVDAAAATNAKAIEAASLVLAIIEELGVLSPRLASAVRPRLRLVKSD